MIRAESFLTNGKCTTNDQGIPSVEYLNDEARIHSANWCDEQCRPFPSCS